MARKKSGSAGKGKAQPDHLSSKDDGTRWVVLDIHGKPVYLTKDGLPKAQAEHLAKGLQQRAGIKQVS